MASPARNNRTPSGAKRRWTADDRARRDAAPTRGRRPVEGAPLSRAARRDATFGADRRRDDAEAGRKDRRPDWYPGPRTNPRRDERAGRDRDRRDDRGDGRSRFERDDRDGRTRSFREERSPRDDRSAGARAPRHDDRARDDRAPRRQDDRPRQERFRDDRPARGRDERSRQDGFRQDRFHTDRPARGRDDGFREDRPARSRDDRFREARPARDRADRFREERPARSRDDRFREERPARSRGDRGERAPRGERPVRSFRADAPAPRRDRRFEERPPRHEQHDRRHDDHQQQQWTPPEDVVLERLEGEVVTPDQVAGLTFTGLGLGDGITKALADLGAVSPFPIQAATIPDALAGRNVLGRGRTGSGKTIAFGAALVERLLRNWHDSGRAGSGRRMGRAPRALILAPTRELALQIDRTVQPIARAVGLFTTQIVGGVPQGRQVGALAKGVDIVIGTPGRIEDLIEQGRLDLSEIEITVLDEADHMADLGFLEPMQRLLRLVPESGQRMLFSATLDAAVAALVDEFLPEPAVHEVADPEGSGTAVHRVLLIEQGEKLHVLQALLASSERSLVFARTRAFAEQLADELDGVGVRAESLHGDLNQARRSRNLARFSDGKVDALVATDVAARGIHVDDVDLVVHADAAEDYKTYLHRSGRTGRAGASGTVVTLLNQRRRRRFAELLERAGIDAEFVPVRAGEDPVAALAR